MTTSSHTGFNKNTDGTRDAVRSLDLRSSDGAENKAEPQEEGTHRSAQPRRVGAKLPFRICAQLHLWGLECNAGFYGRLQKTPAQGRFDRRTLPVTTAPRKSMAHSTYRTLLSSRRNVLAGAGALAGSAVAGLLPGLVTRPSSAFAQAATSYKFKLGDFEIVVVSDGHMILPARLAAPDAPPAELAAANAAAGVTGDMSQPPTNVTLIRAGKELVLIDTGAGPNFMPTTGKLLANLDAAGITPEQVTKVVFTHGHPDHFWGALDDFEENPRFPNAAHLMGAAEWDYWVSDNAEKGIPADRVTFVAAARRNIKGIEAKAQRIKAGEEIVPGVRMIDTPGHTQGHMSVETAGGGETLVVLGDALTHPVISFAHPEWRPAADHVPEQAVATRKKLLDRLATDKARIIGYHLPFPGIGRVEKKDAAYRFVAG